MYSKIDKSHKDYNEMVALCNKIADAVLKDRERQRAKDPSHIYRTKLDIRDFPECKGYGVWVKAVHRPTLYVTLWERGVLDPLVKDKIRFDHVWSLENNEPYGWEWFFRYAPGTLTI